MNIYLVFILFLAGLIMLVKGGDLFVDSSVWMAKKYNISPAIIGATIVSIATTLPEFFVSTISSYEGFSDMAIGNSLGSYICNIAFIIGLCAIIKPIKIQGNSFKIKGFMMIVYLCVFWFLGLDGVITSVEGGLLILLIAVFIVVNLLEHRTNCENNILLEQLSQDNSKPWINIMKFAIGGFFIVYGANILVDTGVEIANFFRIPKQVISLTLLALGTSIPELVTAIASIIKKEESISIGNILGANIMNISVIMGVCALVSPQGLIISNQTLYQDVPMALLVSLIFIFTGIFKKGISRLTGFLLLITYSTYLYILF